jgi:UDP-N-acetylmuramoylalanine--D-glutamate ligase
MVEDKPFFQKAGPPDALAGQRVVVLGLARQGRALGRWLPTIGAQVTLSDSRRPDQLADVIAEFATTPNVRLVLGGHPLDLLDQCDVLCLSGGVPLDIPIVQEALRREMRVTNDAQLFMERCPAPVLGITGSAGKTTTTSLVGETCRVSGRKTFVGGNIGDVLLDVLPEISAEDIVVMELSSFQLELMTTSPPYAAVLNVTPNHLDRHGTMEAYSAAKSHIYLHQRMLDVAIFGYDDPHARRMSRDAPGRMAYFSLHEKVVSGACLDFRQRIVLLGDCAPGEAYSVVCERQMIRLRGEHNVLNTLAACAVAGAAYVPAEAIREAIQTFNGVEHRLETVAEIGGVTWVNDSIATAPERVIAALKSYAAPIVLLAGGRDKKLPWAEMSALAASRCRAVIAFGEYGPQIVEHINRAKAANPHARIEQVILVPDLEQAVAAARRVVRPGDVALLSPGGTSFDAYQDFAARGQHFRDLVRALQ